jgi:hypothetical protein
MGGKGVGGQLPPQAGTLNEALMGLNQPPVQVQPAPAAGMGGKGVGQPRAGIGGKGIGQPPAQQPNLNNALSGLAGAPVQQPAPTPLAPVQQPAPDVNQGIATIPAALPATTAPMYSPHEGMLFGNDFYDRYAQNVGGQFKDPYHNFLVTRGVGSPNGPKLEDLYKQYQASGRTDTPDWATAQIEPISTIPRLSHSWDASGANPVDMLSSAWSPTTPLAEGVTVPEGYWDARLAYNMNLSKAHPDSFKPEDYASGRVNEYNNAAYYALKNGITDINDPRVAAYIRQQASSGMGDRPIW